METPTQPAKRRILVADDNIYMVRTLETVLGLWGFEVGSVYDGAAALAAVRKERPAAVLLDIRLPKLTGLQVARAIRADFASMEVLLIALTGSGDAADRALSLTAGFDHHLVKPVDPCILRKLLDRMPAKKVAAAPDDARTR